MKSEMIQIELPSALMDKIKAEADRIGTTPEIYLSTFLCRQAKRCLTPESGDHSFCYGCQTPEVLMVAEPEEEVAYGE